MEKQFTKGLFFNKPNEKAPDFVKGSLSINVHEFTQWLEQNKNAKGYVNIDLKESQQGKFYAEKNSWEPTQAQQPQEQPQAPGEDYFENKQEINTETIPF